MMKRAWPMRLWLLGVLILVAALSFLSFALIVATMEVTGLAPGGPSSPVPALRTRVTHEWRSWQDPTWQQDVSRESHAAGVDIRLSDAQGHTLFTTAPDPLLTSFPNASAPSEAATNKPATPFRQRQVEVVEVDDQGKPVGYAALFGLWQVQPTSAPVVWSQVALMLTLVVGSVAINSFVAVWLLRRVFLFPLYRLADAARLVREGNLDFDLPRARVKEVAEVLAAFDEMGKDLRSAIVRQAAMEEERRFFLASVSHDLRTPLFSLRGRLEGMRDGLAATPETIRHYIDASLRSVQGLERLVDDLFAYTKLDLLEQVPDRQPLELGDLIHQVIEAAQVRIISKQIGLNLRVPDCACPLIGDSHLLNRALGNLLENAIKYTPSDGTIEIGWQRNQTTLSVWIEDSGPGIAPEVRSHLFVPFHRGETHRPTSPGGTGLGLAIARRVIEAHGGTLTAADQQGIGARFELTLPVAQAKDNT